LSLQLLLLRYPLPGEAKGMVMEEVVVKGIAVEGAAKGIAAVEEVVVKGIPVGLHSKMQLVLYLL